MLQNIFKKSRVPNKLPKDMENLVKKLKKSKIKEECVKKAYSFLTKKYHGNIINTFLKFSDLFISDIDKLWTKSGFLHCINLNYLMRILLIKSELFESEDIQLKWTLIWYISPHQYLRIKINKEKFINIGLWGRAYGIKFGDYARGFHLE